MVQKQFDGDIIEGISTFGAGSSEIIEVTGAARFSCLAVYNVLNYPTLTFDASTTIFASNHATTPSQFYRQAHNLVTGVRVQVTTTNTYPSGLTPVTQYYVIKINDDRFALATTLANAEAGVKISLASSGSGTVTLTPPAVSGCWVGFYRSNNKTDWNLIQTVSQVSVSGSVMLEQQNPPYKYFRAIKTMPNGVFSLKLLTVVLG